MISEGQSSPASTETKLGSTQLRKRQLGTFRTPKVKREREFEESLICIQVNRCLEQKVTDPYLIGLTGGTASGKSSIAKRLVTLGAYCIDCDKVKTNN